MIVTCPDCDTSFQLDESRIPKKGIRVRCSRCKHAFHLAHPSASQSEAVDAVAAEAVTGGGASVPGVTQDLVGPDASDGDGGLREEINNEDAAEWEFNQDIPSTEEEGVGDDDGSLFGTGLGRDEPSGLDLATDEPAPAEADAPTVDFSADVAEPAPAAQAAAAPSDEPLAGADAAPGPDASAFGSVDDFSSLMDDDPLDTASAPQADGTADELRAQASEASGTYAQEGQVDDLGDPEKWDFFDGASPPATPAPAPASGGVTLGRIGQLSGRSGATDEIASDWSASVVSDPAERGRVAVLFESVGRMVGWTIVLVGFGLGLVGGLWGTAESFVAGERVTPIGALEAVDMRAGWVDTARAGRLLVVSGGLRNPTRRSVPIGGALEVTLLDRFGESVLVPPVSAGVTLSERQLRELPAEVLDRLREQAARELGRTAIPAGGLLPFQAVIFDAPTTGLRFDLRLDESGALSLPPPAPAESLDEVAALDADADGPALDAEPVQEEGSAQAASGVQTQPGVAGDPVAEAVAPTPVRPAAPASPSARPAAPASPASPAAPGYDDPYGDDSGMGLQDL